MDLSGDVHFYFHCWMFHKPYDNCWFHIVSYNLDYILYVQNEKWMDYGDTQSTDVEGLNHFVALDDSNCDVFISCK